MYAGSPVQLNFGESAKRGGYIVTLVKESGWKLADKPKFVRMDLDARVRPLVTVTDAEQNVPDNALIRLATNVVLSKKQRRAIVKRVVVDDGIDTKKVSERIVNALPFDPIADDVRNILVAMRKEFDNVYAAKTTRKDKEAFMSARRGLRALVHNSIDSYRSSAITEGVGR